MAGLRSLRFAGVAALEACLAGGHRMMRPETGVAVQRVQQALIDLGFAIPSGATGSFLDETEAAVVSFKVSHALVPADPVVGPGTMRALDEDILVFDEGGSSAMPSHPPTPAGAHCWVAPEGIGAAPEAWPGLLVEWRQSGPDWEARVVFLSRTGSQRWVMAEDWLPRHRLTPL